MRRDNFYRWFFIIVVILTVLAAIVGSIFLLKEPDGGKKKEEDTIVKENVHVITEDDTLKSVQEDKLIFDKKPKYKVGDVLVAGIIEGAEDGFIRRVTSIESENGEYVVYTEYALLTDVFEKAHIEKRIALIDEDNQYAKKDSERNDSNRKENMVLNTNQKYSVIKLSEGNSKENESKENEQNNSSKSDETDKANQENKEDEKEPVESEYMFGKAFEKEISEHTEISGDVGVSVWVEVVIDIDKGEIEFEISLNGKEGGNITATYSRGYEPEIKPFQIFNKKLPNCQFIVCGIPIVITNELGVDLKASVSLQGSIETSYGWSGEQKLGAKYSSKTNKVEKIKEPEKPEKFSDGLDWGANYSFSGEGSAGISLHLITKLYGSTGLDISTGPLGKIEGELEVSSNEDEPNGNLSLGIELQIEGTLVVEVPIIAKGLTETPIFQIRLEICSKEWSSPEEDSKKQDKTNSEATKDGSKPDVKDESESEVEDGDDLDAKDEVDSKVTDETESASTDTGAEENANAYQTRYAKTNSITAPEFQFDTPSGWEIISDDVNSGQIEEKIVLANQRGVTVTYWDCQGKLGGDARSILKTEVLKVADSAFVPGYPAGTDRDCSTLGNFMVAKVHIVGEMIPGVDSDYMSVDKAFYAVLPESYAGEREVQGQAGNVDEFSFEYPNLHAFIAESPDGTFTAEEEQQVIQILRSFKSIN